jgi:SAM-dependent methyltransferase
MRFDEIGYAEFYHRQQVDSGYPGKLLPFILKELEGSASVLDIGSGTGFFSIPLAETGHLVTSVEPSAGMIDIMKKNSSAGALSSIRICHVAWENWNGVLHDAAICVHSLYPMEDVKNAVSLINKSAIKKIIIVRDSAGMKTLSGIVRDTLGKSSNRDLNNDIALTLEELAVSWRVVNIHEERKHYINDIRHEADSILYQLRLDSIYRDEIFNIVRKEINNTEDSGFFNAVYSDNAYIFSNND